MSLRRRLVLLTAGTVGVTVLLVSVLCWVAIRGQLRGEIDDALMEQGNAAQQRFAGPGPPGQGFGGGMRGGGFQLPPPRPGEGAGLVQILDADGRPSRSSDAELDLPVTEDDLAVVRGERERVLADRDVDGEHLRVLTVRVREPDDFGRGPVAVQIARSLESADSTLSRLWVVLAALCLVGTAFALAVSRLVARGVLRPVTELSDAAEHIGTTEDLGRRIEATGDDEVGRMAQRFNAMLDRLQSSRNLLAASVASQRQLVADASHELRTPVTSLRTNIEVLIEGGVPDEDERRRLLVDVREQTEELGALVADVIELARGDQPLDGGGDDVRLDHVVAESVERARRHWPDVGFDVDVEPVVVDGAPDRLGRAVSNLLENAAGHAPPGTRVAVSLSAAGVFEVRDHGPGVADADKPLVFDRFYRGETARARPGSGLGLAIVKQAAEAHGGTVEVVDAPGGGALFRLSLPVGASAGPDAAATSDLDAAG